MTKKEHKSGYVNIIGKPNVGKSTLTNSLMGGKLSIITSKPQTTRHRILGILNDENYQIIISDTPGHIDDPSYKMQEAMNRFVATTFEDGDIMIFLTDIFQDVEEESIFVNRLKKMNVPKILVINKTDISDEQKVSDLLEYWSGEVEFANTLKISALNDEGVENLKQLIIDNLPLGPAYYPKDQFTDRSERFFVEEIIREKLLLNYRQEIPYSAEIVVDNFIEKETKAGEPIIHIYAFVYVERKSQKFIIIGKKGESIKKLASESRKDIEKFFDKKVFLELYVKVKEDWRNKDNYLNNFGYNS